MMRLAKLGLYTIMPKFLLTYCYIDDLCVLNNPDILLFLQPKRPREPSCPFQIYPFPIVEIQTELDATRDFLPRWGLAGHFLNVKLEISDFSVGTYHTTKFDKHRSLPFPFQQYIQFKSNTPVLQSYMIIMSQIMPILYMCSIATTTQLELLVLSQTLQDNGFCSRHLSQLIYQVCSTLLFPSIKFQIQDLLNILEHF